MSKKLAMPCTLCGTMLQVEAEAEAIYCTTCGTRIELGVHSYRSKSDTKRSIFCNSCDRALDPESTGLIFSCYNCGETVCTNCAIMVDEKRFCSKCGPSVSTSKLPGKKKAEKKPKTKSTRVARKPRSSSIAKRVKKTGTNSKSPSKKTSKKLPKKSQTKRNKSKKNSNKGKQKSKKK